MNSSRPRTLLRSATLGVAAIALAACSGVHPGSAAVVDGETISMGTVDKAAAAYCKLSLAVAKQQGTGAVNSSDTRRQSVADLVTYAVAKKLVKERDLAIDPNSYVITAAQREQIDKAFPGADLKQISQAIERSQETYAIALALGEESTFKRATDANSAEIEKAGRAEIAKAMKASDISIDPRFGLDDATKKIDDTGSLSVAAVTAGKVDPAEVPAAQRCA